MLGLRCRVSDFLVVVDVCRSATKTSVYQFDFVLDSEFLLEEELPFEHEHFHLNSRDWF